MTPTTGPYDPARHPETDAAALRPLDPNADGGGLAPRAAARLVSVRQVRRRAEVRHAGAGRHGANAPPGQLQLVDQLRGDCDRDLRRLRVRARRRRAARARLHVVEAAPGADD